MFCPEMMLYNSEIWGVALLHGYEWRIRFDGLQLSTTLLRGLPTKSTYTIYNSYWIKGLHNLSHRHEYLFGTKDCCPDDFPWYIITKLEHKLCHACGSAVYLFDEKYSCYCTKTTKGVAYLQQEQQTKKRTPSRDASCFMSFYFVILEASVWCLL